jgi:hypothetical protein
LYTYKRKKARELMQLQADAFFKHQKNALWILVSIFSTTKIIVTKQ